MSARASTSALKVRSFSSTTASQLPPKQLSSKAALYARNKKQATEGDDAASGSGASSHLSEVTVAPPDLRSLQVMHPESLTRTSIGQVKAFPDPALDAFKTLSIPASVQKEFAFTSRPASVVRQATLDVKHLIDQSKSKSSTSSRHIINGEAGTGKSTLMLQAVSYAQSSGFVIIYLPSATPLVNSSTPHIYSEPRALFDQPVLSAQLLTKLATVNKQAFKEIKTTKAYQFGTAPKFPAGKSLEELSKQANGDDKIVTSVFEALIEELSTQKTRPVLLAIDDCQSLFTTSSYVDPSYNQIESFSLVVPRLLLEFVSGQRSFESGSVLLAPCSLSPVQSPALTDFLASSSPSTTLTPTRPTAHAGLSSAYDRSPATTSHYSTYLSTLSSVSSTYQLSRRMTRQESVGVVELLRQARGVRVREGQGLGDQQFLERFVSSSGNWRQFVNSLRKSVVA
ncbi:mitochondrial 37S ribosomal protein mS29 RSM23 [Sporobolomyces koalae]|uniref:mitochondrial 37S ribosomal protein mS29 RSM23 n=1 Tax=Sporobolomyces koalae TaxID=500713 RepID=UPI00316F4535